HRIAGQNSKDCFDAPPSSGIVLLIKNNAAMQETDFMQIGIPRESLSGETRVAATPETVKKYIAAKHTVIVEQGAGGAAHFTDDAYTDAGATLGNAVQALGADLVLKVRAPNDAELA